MTSLKWLADTFAGRKLDEITRATLYGFEMTRYRAGVSKPTIRRDLSCLSSVISSAVAWEWLNENPVRGYLKNRAIHGLKEAAAHPLPIP